VIHVNFYEPLSQIGKAELQELLTDGAAENTRLEFKAEAPIKDETLACRLDDLY